MEEVESAFHLCFDAREMRITASSAQTGLLVRKPDNFVRQQLFPIGPIGTLQPGMARKQEVSRSWMEKRVTVVNRASTPLLVIRSTN